MFRFSRCFSVGGSKVPVPLGEGGLGGIQEIEKEVVRGGSEPFYDAGGSES